MNYQTKQDVRERVLALLRNQEEEKRLNNSLIIGSKLLDLPEFKKAGTILFYASFDGEVDTFEIMKKAQLLNKKIGLPVVQKGEHRIVPTIVEHLDEQLSAGEFGIKEPTTSDKNTLELNNIDLVVVPGVAFDKHNNRLGRGGGYYDRFLKDLPKTTSTVGLAFDFQIVENLPQEEHDIALSYVLTN